MAGDHRGAFDLNLPFSEGKCQVDLVYSFSRDDATMAAWRRTSKSSSTNCEGARVTAIPKTTPKFRASLSCQLVRFLSLSHFDHLRL